MQRKIYYKTLSCYQRYQRFMGICWNLNKTSVIVLEMANIQAKDLYTQIYKQITLSYSLIFKNKKMVFNLSNNAQDLRTLDYDQCFKVCIINK